MKKHFFFNFRLIGLLIFEVILVLLSIGSLVGEDSSLVGSFVFLGLSLLTLFVMCILPIYWTIDASGIKIQYLFGFYEAYDWNVDDIFECGMTASSTFIRNYCIIGNPYGKRAFFTQGEINRSRRARELIRKYWRSDFDVYTKKEKKAPHKNKTNKKNGKKRR